MKKVGLPFIPEPPATIGETSVWHIIISSPETLLRGGLEGHTESRDGFLFAKDGGGRKSYLVLDSIQRHAMSDISSKER